MKIHSAGKPFRYVNIYVHMKDSPSNTMVNVSNKYLSAGCAGIIILGVIILGPG